MSTKSLYTMKSLILVFLIYSFSSLTEAQNIDPAMLSKFQSLPKSQQQALAKQYGVNLNQLQSLNTQKRLPLAQIGEPLVQRNNENENSELDFFELLKKMDEFGNTKDDEIDELKRYGMHLFDQEVSTFAPTDNAQVPNDYRLGVGDELIIQFLGKESDELIVEVNRDGQITIPKLGNLNISGMLFSDATTLIKERVANSFIGVSAFISMGRLRVINLFMAGEVKIPGAYSVSALTTITQALFQAGGISDIGSLRDVQVKRQGEVVARFDVYDLLLRGDSSNDVRLRSGDVIFVPTFNSLVEVNGEVRRPMLYELKGSETIIDALNMAGGLKSNAFNSKVVLIKRSKENNLPEVINIQLADQQQSSLILSDGDKIIAQSLSDAVTNSVTLSGAVIRDGTYGWFPGIRVSDLITDVRRDLQSTADLEYSLIIREKNARLDIEVLQFSIIDSILNPEGEKDPLLHMHDQILVFDSVSTTMFDQKKNKQRPNIDDFDQNQFLDEPNSQELSVENENQEIIDKLREQRQDQNDLDAFEEDEDSKLYSENSRELLLAPILDKLKSQAREGSPVQLVSITGAVKSPGQYPISKGFNARLLAKAAGGFKDSAFLRSVELRRITEDDEGVIKAFYEKHDLSDVDRLEQLLLQSRDNLNIRENADWNPEDTIEITGEVKFPGTYLISKGETLKDVIARAGGLSDEAFADGAVFTRESIAEVEEQRAKEFSQAVQRDFASSILTEEQNDASFNDVFAITRQLESFKGQGRLLIELHKAIAGNSEANIQLVDGDKLYIPKSSSTVTIIGEVRRQGSHSFQQTIDLDGYITLAAGMTKRADEDGLYIVKANGSVIIPNTSLTSFGQSGTALQAGDTIVVPVDSQYKDSIPLWRDITQIIYQGTVALAAVVAL